jgi:dUTP pyrophosphatase|tara:strand:+ start:2777 stop:3241 length:465 start_codon:yes stop_codon:yes gene_type:complete
MKNKTINFKKTNHNASSPLQSHTSDSGYDLTATDVSVRINEKTGYISYIEYNTGISIEPPENIYFLLYPRSSIRKYDLSLCNSVGVIDTSYRGDVLVCFTPTFPTKTVDDLIIYKQGDRIAQLIPQILLNVDFVESKDIKDTLRGSGGFGSSGK